MTNTKHTPAPWHIVSKVDVADSDGYHVCSVPTSNKTQEERIANARLIAAAPKLLKTLKAVMACMQKRTPWDDAKIILTEAHKVIREAEGNL